MQMLCITSAALPMLYIDTHLMDSASTFGSDTSIFAGITLQRALWRGLAACFASDCSLSRFELLEAVKLLSQLLPSFPKLLMGEVRGRDSTEAALEEYGYCDKRGRRTAEADLWRSALTCFGCLSREEVRSPY